MIFVPKGLISIRFLVYHFESIVDIYDKMPSNYYFPATKISSSTMELTTD